jgi:hypothetical protein
MGRAKDGCVNGAGGNTEIVNESATAAQQRAVFHAFDRSAYPRTFLGQSNACL